VLRADPDQPFARNRKRSQASIDEAMPRRAALASLLLFMETKMLKLLSLGALACALTAGSAWAANTAKDPAASKTTQAPSQASAVGQVWDWSKIDTNGDNLVEPAEMESWLKANPGVQKGG
jgi:hypothetical protein